MAIRTVVTRGFGNGTFNGTIALVTTRGYTQAIVVLFSPDSRISIKAARDNTFTPAGADRTFTPASTSRTFTPADE